MYVGTVGVMNKGSREGVTVKHGRSQGVWLCKPNLPRPQDRSPAGSRACLPEITAACLCFGPTVSGLADQFGSHPLNCRLGRK